MIQDLTKSMLRCGWALSVLGLRQAGRLLSPGEGWDQSSAAFDAVRRAAEAELDEGFGGLFRAGDQLQTGMVDAAADLAAGSWSEPVEALARARDTLDRSVGRLAGRAG